MRRTAAPFEAQYAAAFAAADDPKLRCDDDDRAAPGLTQVRDDGLCRQVDAADIHREDALPLVERRVGDGATAGDARAGDGDVEPAESRGDLVDGTTDVLFLHHTCDRAVVGVDLREPLLVAVDRRDPNTVAPQTAHGCCSDAGGPAGDERSSGAHGR